MKLTAMFLFAICLSVAARTTGQTVTLSVKDVSIKEVFKEIQKQTGLNVLVEEALIDKTGKVTMDVSNMPVDKVLNLCFRDESLQYNIKDGAIMITEAMEITPSPSERAGGEVSAIDLKGHVNNENGEPLEGVNITVKGTRRVTTTNANGEFTLTDIDPNATIVITMAEYETQEIPLAGRSSLFIKLKPRATSVEEVTVNKGYYSVKQKYNTGNVVKIDGKDIAKQPATDPVLALQGRVPGLTITQSSGLPGSGITVRLRGQNTMDFNKPPTANNPLYIVDGVPFNSQSVGKISSSSNTYIATQELSPFTSIAPSEIESIEILKDADALSLYGSRGANGVILITTKKGKPGPARVSVSLTSGYSKATRLVHLMNTRQYLQILKEGVINDGQLPYLPQSAQYYPDLMIWDTTRYTDWQKVLINKPASFSTANVNLSGGTNTAFYNIGATYSYNGATVPGSFADKIGSMHASISNSSLNQRFHSQFNVNYSYENNRLPGMDKDLFKYITLAPDAPPIYDDNGNLNWGPYYQGNPTNPNPYGFLLRYSKQVNEGLNGSFKMDYELIKGLKIESLFGYSRSMNTTLRYIPATSSAPPYLNIYRKAEYGTNNLSTWIIEPGASYHKKLWKGNLDINIGGTLQSSSSSSWYAAAESFPSDELIPYINAASQIYPPYMSNSVNRQGGFYGRLGYTWNEKYAINFTERGDGSSRFGSGKRFGKFSSVGAEWNFSSETWMKNVRILSSGKLRGSYGITGSDAIGDYQFLSTYRLTPNSYSYQGSIGLIPTGLSNPSIQWEENKKLDIGVDLGFFKNRLNISLGWYRNQTTNQLVSYPLPYTSGFTSVTANLPALIQNQGWELSVHSDNIKGKRFNWTTNFNISRNRNKLMSFPGIEKTPYNGRYFVGYSLSTQKLLHYIGVDPQTGVYQFASKDGLGSPSLSEGTIYKDLAPSFFGGIENSFSYKQLSLSVSLSFKKQIAPKFTALFGGGNNLPGTSNSNFPVQVYERIWHNPGDKAAIQRPSTYLLDYSNTSYSYSDGIYTDASFIRIQTVVLSYSFTETVLKRMHLKGLNFSLSAQNLFTLTRYEGSDPDAPNSTVPPYRTVTCGVNITF